MPATAFRSSAALAVSAVVVLLGGCAALGLQGPRVPRAPIGGSETYGRPSDSLLARADLRAIVDAQVLRRGDLLTAALGSADPTVRARAAFALGSVQDAEAVPALLALLGDPDPRVRADAAFALGQSADSSVSLALVNAVARETHGPTRRELLDALGKIGGSASLTAVLDLDLPAEIEPARTLSLARYGLRGLHEPAAAAWLADRLTSPDPALRAAAAYYFGRVRSADPWRRHASAVRAAFDRLRPGDPARLHLATALGRLRDPADLPRLADALTGDADWRVRVNAARALAPLAAGSATNAAPLLTALSDPDDHVARTAAEVLAADTTLHPAVVPTLDTWAAGNPRRPLVVASLLPALARAGREGVVLAWLDRPAPSRTDAATPFHRALAVTALGAGRDPASLDRLFGFVQATDPRVASAAVEALRARWAAARTSASDAESRRYYDAFAAALRRRDLATTSAAAPALADTLFRGYDPGATLREVYAQLQAPRDIEPMVEIVRAIGRVRDEEEVEFLLGVALGGHPVLRQAANDALDERLVQGIDVDATNLVAPPTVLMEWDYVERLGPRPLLVLTTRHGAVVVEMDTEQAPQTVMRLAKTAVLRRYDGVPFHRVVPNFVVQGGDHFRQDGYGGPDVNLRSEFTRLPYATGAAGMASAGKDTEGVQYFVTHSPQPHLDGRYTAFGRVIAGMDVVDRLQPGDVVLRARIVRTSQRR